MSLEFDVVAAFSNEAHIITEWITHYLNEGARHIYLIDNASTDNVKSRIERHPRFADNVITYIHEPSKKISQSTMINKNFGKHKAGKSWVLVVDIDDFVYSREDTIRVFLNKFLTEHKDASQILFPVRIFGSSGLVQQPDSVVQSFIQHMPYSANQPIKSLVDASRIMSFGVNHHYTSSGKCYLSSGHKATPITESVRLPNSDFPVVANRYAIQSLEIYMNIKAKKSKQSQPRKTIDMVDANCTEENRELADKVYEK